MPTAFHPAANVAKMAAGTPLDDDDRYPWLDAVGQWLADHDDGVMSCSALKRRYRDQLRSYRADIVFLHLTGSPELIGSRQADRPGHFMPSSLVMSQFDALEPLDPDERGMTIDVAQSVDTIVEAFVRFLVGQPLTTCVPPANSSCLPCLVGLPLIVTAMTT